MRSNRTLVLVAVGAAATSSSAQFWEIGAGTLSTSISSNGVVVGDNNSTGQYFMWSAGTGAMDIGGVVAGNGAGGQATISDDGMWVGGTTLSHTSGAFEMGRYDVASNGWSALGGIPVIGGQIDASISSGWSISGDGQTHVGLGWLSTGRAHATSWSNGVMTDLGSTVDDRSSRANGANYDGSVVVGWQDGAGRQGAVWVDGQQQLIFNGSGGAEQEAFAVTDDGTMVTGIGSGGFAGPGELWIWNTDTQMHRSLGNLAAGGERNIAGTAISADGSLIVGGTWGFGPATFGKAIAWTEDTGVILFGDYLDSVGAVYDDGFDFAFVSDMSSDGEWFTGWGRNASGSFTSFVVNVPTPAGLPVLAMGGLFAARRRR